MALILVLVLLALGGLTIATSLNYVSTLIYDNQVSGWAMDCMYSAGAGVEYAIWALENDEPIPAYLSFSSLIHIQVFRQIDYFNEFATKYF